MPLRPTTRAISEKHTNAKTRLLYTLDATRGLTSAIAIARFAETEAAKTLHGIKSIDIKNFQARVKNDEIVEFQINAQILFVIESD